MKMLDRVFCMRLKTAGIVIGWLGVALSCLVTIFLFITLGFSDEIAKEYASNTYGEEQREAFHTSLVIGCSISLAIVVFKLLSSALLVWGTIKESHLMLLPWLINCVFAFVVNILYSLVVLSTPWADSTFLEANFPALVTVFLLGRAWDVYIFYGIYSLYKHLQSSRKQEHPLINQSKDVNIKYENNFSSYSRM